MKGTLKYLAAVASLSLAVLTGPPAQASSWDAAFYELTENMSLGALPDGTPIRIGVGALMGTANVGTALCPEFLIQALIGQGLIAGAIPCTVTATGSDTISLANGSGTLGADVAVTIELDNPVDAPEFVVMTGRIDGTLQVIDPHNRLILIGGSYTTRTIFGGDVALPAVQFTGKVRLPFVKNEAGESRKPRRFERAYYLGDDGKLIRVRANEESLGMATARFELNFVVPDPTPQ